MQTTKPLPSATATLVITTLIQVLTSLCSVAVPVLAPAAGRELGFEPVLAGYFIGIAYLFGATSALLTGSLVLRYGSIRVSQCALLSCAVAMSLLAVLPLAWMPLAALFLGMGYGPITPASSHVLAKTTPPHMMALMFSIKQTGVTLGGALAGILLPPIVTNFSWRTAAVTTTVLSVITVLIAQSLRAALDGDRDAKHPVSLRSLAQPFRMLAGNAALLRLCLTGGAYAGLQMCFTAYIVAYLTHDFAYTLAAAGVALAAGNFAGVAGRIVWGSAADRTRNARGVLGWLGVMMTVAAFGIAAIGPAWPAAITIALCLLFGATGVSWNGVQIAESARLAPPGQAAVAASCSTFMAYAGIMSLPPIFALIHDASDSYRVPYVLLALPALACGVWLLVAKPGRT